MTATPTAKWVRVRLTSPTTDGPSLTEGELILRADMIDHQRDCLVFLLADQEVFRLDRAYYATSAWFVDRPTFAEWLKARRAKHPNQRRPWSAEELRRLDDEIGLYGMDWQQVAKAHGRTVSAVRRKATELQRIEA